MQPEPDYPLVSFVTTCYNAEAVITEAVQGMLSVEWPNKEIVLLNDGSDDATGDICRKLAAENDCICFLDRPRLGRARALNEAVEAAQGEFIAINDADDLSLTHRLAVTIPILVERDDIGLLSTSARLLSWVDWGDFTQHQAERPGDLELEFIVPEGLYMKNGLVASTMVFRKNAFHAAGGFNEALSSSIDYDFYFRVLTFSKVARIDVETCRFRTGFGYMTFFRGLGPKQRMRNRSLVRAFARTHFRIPLKTRLIVRFGMYWGFLKVKLRRDAPRVFALTSAIKRRTSAPLSKR